MKFSQQRNTTEFSDTLTLTLKSSLEQHKAMGKRRDLVRVGSGKPRPSSVQLLLPRSVFDPPILGNHSHVWGTVRRLPSSLGTCMPNLVVDGKRNESSHLQQLYRQSQRPHPFAGAFSFVRHLFAVTLPSRTSSERLLVKLETVLPPLSNQKVLWYCSLFCNTCTSPCDLFLFFCAARTSQPPPSRSLA